MKTERLLEIIIYLLNHKSATGKELSQKFQVSLRTIQRDITCICAAGVPVVSQAGVNGSYSILPDYKISNQFLKKNDFDIMITALRSLSTAYDNEKIDTILEKYLLLSDSQTTSVHMDYSVSKEDKNVQNNRSVIEKALNENLYLNFNYRNIHSEFTQRFAEPIMLKFKWYAWYLYAFDRNKEDCRTFKLSRIRDIALSTESFEPRNNKTDIVDKLEKDYLDTCETIQLWVDKDSIIAVEDLFPDIEKQETEGGHYLLKLRIPPNELLWKGFLLSLGRGVKVLSPKYYRDSLIQISKDFLTNYDT